MSASLRSVCRSAGALLLASVTLASGGCGADATRQGRQAEPAGSSAAPPAGFPGKVVRAIDGDTVDLEIEGDQRRVRILGIDAPESTTKRTGRVECGGDQAADAMRGLAARSPQVVVAFDPTQDSVDRYGRLLAYVTPASGGRTWAEQMLRLGWAEVYEQRGAPVQLDQAFRAAATIAEEAGVGVWKLCGGNFHSSR